MVLVLLFLVTGQVMTEAAARRIAILPILEQGTGIDPASAELLQNRLRQEFHVPLNGTLQAVALLPEAQTARALQQKLQTAGGKVQLSSLMEPLAEDLQAEIVIGIVVDGFSQYQYTNWRGDTILESQAAIRLVGYDRIRKTPIRGDLARWFRSEYDPAQTASVLAQQELDELLARADLRKEILPFVVKR